MTNSLKINVFDVVKIGAKPKLKRAKPVFTVFVFPYLGKETVIVPRCNSPNNENKEFLYYNS